MARRTSTKRHADIEGEEHVQHSIPSDIAVKVLYGIRISSTNVGDSTNINARDVGKALC